MPDILHRIGIKSSLGNGLSRTLGSKGIAGSWTGDIKASPAVGRSTNSDLATVGSTIWKSSNSSLGKRVRWRCVDRAKEWIGTELTFDLRQENGRTVVLFAHRGWKEQVEFMHYCSTEWATYMLSLKLLCETGNGTPYPGDVDIG